MTDMPLIRTVDVEGDAFAGAAEAILDAAARALDRPFDGARLQLRAEDGEGRMLGGLVGSAMQGWFYVRLLAVDAEARNLGIGARLLGEAEKIARAQGLVGIYLDTFDFQAPRFYLREGYREIGRLPAIGDAPQRIWFAKEFKDSGS